MIITNNEEALRVKCEKVLPEEVGALVEVLERELEQYNKVYKNGIGLAAPQIGIAKDISIIRLGGEFNVNLVNAKIGKMYDQIVFKEEGCLSFPGRLEDTSRFQEIEIVGNLWEVERFVATGFFAVACQHEIDHLNSSLFIDKIVKPKPSIKLKPNDPCYCGSDKKFKKCCGK